MRICTFAAARTLKNTKAPAATRAVLVLMAPRRTLAAMAPSMAIKVSPHSFQKCKAKKQSKINGQKHQQDEYSIERVSTLRSDNPVIIKKRKSAERLLLLPTTAGGVPGFLCKLNGWRKIKRASLKHFDHCKLGTRAAATLAVNHADYFKRSFLDWRQRSPPQK